MPPGKIHWEEHNSPFAVFPSKMNNLSPLIEETAHKTKSRSFLQNSFLDCNRILKKGDGYKEKF